MSQSLRARISRLESRQGGRRWYVVERAAEWQGDVMAALGLAVARDDLVVVIKRYGRADVAPRLVTEYVV